MENATVEFALFLASVFDKIDCEIWFFLCRYEISWYNVRYQRRVAWSDSQVSYIEEKGDNMKNWHRVTITLTMILVIFALLITGFQLAVYGDSHYRFYKKEYEKYRVTDELNMKIDDVMAVTKYMMNYLIGKEEKLSVVTTVEGKEQDFFNERDRLHMRDVRNLFLGGIKVGIACLLIAAIILEIFIKKEKNWKKLFLRTYTMALVVWLLIGILLGVAFAVDFTTCFTIFHKIFFTNNLWIFDPATDYMIRMLPEGFFSDMVIRIAEVFGTVLVVSWIVLFLLCKKSTGKTTGK